MTYNIKPPTFTIETDRLTIGLETACLQCGRPFRLRAAVWAMRVGHECLGYFCPDCLNDRARVQLETVAAQVNQRTSDDD